MHIAREHSVGELDVTRRREIPDRHPSDLEAEPRASLDGVTLCLDELHERSSDIAATEDTDPDQLIVVRHEGGGYGIDRRRPMTVSGR
jgi:hypothetical protein